MLLLFSGVDTLECTFEGEIDADRLEELRLAKFTAQATNNPVAVDLEGETFYVQAKGQGFYSLILTDSRMRILVNGSKGGPPAVFVRLRASALAAVGHEALYEQACVAVKKLGRLQENTLSRLDLFADLQGFTFTDSDFENLVCHATYRGIHKDGQGLTYQIGRRDVVMRIYRKDAELAANKKLGYAAAWERTEAYEPDEPVFRVEIQLRGNILSELNARSVRTAFGKLGKLFAFGMGWCELRVPTNDQTKQRWPVDIRWTLIQLLWSPARPEKRVRRQSLIQSRDAALKSLLGPLATVAAYSGKEDLVEALIEVHHGLERLLGERGEEFAGHVQVKAAKIASEEGLMP